MNKDDESELYRLTDLLSEIDNKAELTTNQIEALKKAALSLSISFIHGYRKELEELYQNGNDELTAEQKEHLRSFGLRHDNNG